MLNKRPGAGSSAISAFRVSEWSVRRKVVLVLALPVVLAAVFGGLRVSSEFSAALGYTNTAQRVTTLGPALHFVSDTERLALPTALADATSSDGKSTPQQAYDAAAKRLRDSAKSAGLTADQSRTIAQMLQIGDQFRNGTGIGANATPSVALSNLERLTTQLVNSTTTTQGTPDPRTQALVQILNARLSLTKQQLLLQSTGTHSQLGLAWFTAETGVEGSALDNLKALLGNTGRVSTLGSANVTRLGSAAGGDLKDLGAKPGMFLKYDALADRLLSSLDVRLTAQANASKSRALTDGAIILAALLASLLLALFVARALIRPLRKVRAGALDVANVQLPETVKQIRAGKEIPEFVPIDVHTREELGQLARAVDDMHRQAVTLATGEAQLRSQVGAMFVTLSRRNTTLVNQQLALIESLEQDEEDPQRLEQLFSLDHLATRMRRTAESLVILGGTSGRTAAGLEALSVSDVVHAAVSEVQDYQRVRIDAAPDRQIVGRAASDVVHLLAELIDNALSYSPPGSPVSIQASEEDGRVEIEIVDSGLGMAGNALAEANASLKGGGEVTVDTARRMGLFVVSRLADQHDLKVKLRPNVNGGGIIASITLPAAALVGDGPVQYTSLLDEPEPTDESAEDVAVVEEPEEEYDPYLERIEDAIAAVTGLPRRRPGHTREEPAVATPSVSMWDPEPLAPAYEPAVLEAAPEKEREPIALGPVETDEEEVLADVVTGAFGHDRSITDEADTDDEQVAEDADDSEVAEVAEVAEVDADDEDEDEDEATTVVAEAPAAEDESEEQSLDPVASLAEMPEVHSSTPGPEGDAPMRLTIRRPLSAAPAASALEGEFVKDETAVDSPIFGQLTSNWLDGDAEQPWEDDEADAAWDAASRVDSEAGVRTQRGLPVRRPGNRLVPGGVTPEPVVAVRDPEAIRNRLAAHAAGVSRGRAAANAQPITDDYAHEETGPA